MDLYLSGARPSPAERQAVDAALGPPVSGWQGGERHPETDGHAALGGHESRERRHLLLPALHAAQTRSGFISPGSLNYICQRLAIPPSEAYGVASFYAMFSLAPRPKAVAHLCDDVVCRIRGAGPLSAELEHRLGPPGGGAAGASMTWLRSPCLGLCERAPAALVTLAGERPAERAMAPAARAVRETAPVNAVRGPPAVACKVESGIRSGIRSDMY